MILPMKTVVGVSDLKVSSDVNEIIVTYALGSCLGIAVYDPIVHAGGLLHVMLPLSKADAEKAKAKPAMYVDTGLNILLNKVYRLGGQKENLLITVAGGASMKRNGKEDYFKIGQKNFAVLWKLLRRNCLSITNKDVGGTKSRTMALRIANGEVLINKKPI